MLRDRIGKSYSTSLYKPAPQLEVSFASDKVGES
jgi:hypothetical protein